MVWHFTNGFLTFAAGLIRLLLLAIVALSMLLLVVKLDKFNDEVQSFNGHLNAFNENVPVLVYGVGSVNRSIDELTASINERHEEIEPELETFNYSFKQLNHYLPFLINESYSLRQELPGILEEIDSIVGQAGAVSKAASEGAVEGAMRGVLSLPAEVISSILTLPIQAVKKTQEKFVGDGKSKINKSVDGSAVNTEAKVSENESMFNVEGSSTESIDSKSETEF